MRAEDVMNFLVVAETPTLLAASAKLGMSQPTLSKSIARLERALGIALIERLPRGVALTEAGRAFLVHSRPAALGLREGVDAVREIRTGRAGTVRVGLGVGVPQMLVIEALKPLLKDGSLSVEISGGMSNSLSKAVAAGECDFAITSVMPAGLASVLWEPLYFDPMVPVASARHPMATLRRTSWEMLSRQTWVIPGTGTSVRAWFEQQFTTRGVPLPTQVISMRDYSVTPEFGAGLDAISLTPRSFMRVHPKAQDFVAVRTPADWQSDRYVGLMRRTGGQLSPAAQRLVDRIQGVARSKFG